MVRFDLRSPGPERVQEDACGSWKRCFVRLHFFADIGERRNQPPHRGRILPRMSVGLLLAAPEAENAVQARFSMRGEQHAAEESAALLEVTHHVEPEAGAELARFSRLGDQLDGADVESDEPQRPLEVQQVRCCFRLPLGRRLRIRTALKEAPQFQVRHGCPFLNYRGRIPVRIASRRGPGCAWGAGTCGSPQCSSSAAQ